MGQAADIHAMTAGMSTFSIEAGGAVILRRDHTTLTSQTGKSLGGFDQIMTIHAEPGGVRADYFDPSHVIHYTDARIDPGASVVFSNVAAATMPAFRLCYALRAKGVLTVEFSASPLGSSNFRTIASGRPQRSGPAP